MAQERIRFQGDPEPMETGSGKGAEIPLDKRVRPTQVEMLNQKGGEDDDYGDNEEEGQAPNYTRENIGPRIGNPVEEAQKVAALEQELDKNDVVPCLFPTKVQLQDKGLMHTWAPGVHMVPVDLAGDKPKEMHWWLKRNRVRHAGKRMPREALTSTQEDED